MQNDNCYVVIQKSPSTIRRTAVSIKRPNNTPNLTQTTKNQATMCNKKQKTECEDLLPTAINDAVVVPNKNSFDSQEVFIARVIALSDDGRLVVKREDHLPARMLIEAEPGQYVCVGKWEFIERRKKLFGGRDKSTWKFRPR